MKPEDILATYDRNARDFTRSRDKTLFERKWLDRMLDHAVGRRVLDLGCGAGVPIARYLADRRARVTGVDGAQAMIELFRENLPTAESVHADMRGLELGREFDAIIAWDSLFHLSPDDQSAMFATFAAHAAPRSVLLFTAGPAAGETRGRVADAPVYHASLDAREYRALFAVHGFAELAYAPQDPECHGHTIWMARFTGTA